MEHTEIKLELPPEVKLPVKVIFSDPYWSIRDAEGYIFMGRKNQELAMRSIAWLLNDCEEIKRCWNEHDTLKAKAEMFDELIKLLKDCEQCKLVAYRMSRGVKCHGCVHNAALLKKAKELK